MALAPLLGSVSASARLSSQVGRTLSTMPSQSSSAAGGTPPSMLAVAMTSIAPGLTLGSQSLQSPSLAVQPSPSPSTSGSWLQGPGTPEPEVGTKPPPPPPPPVPDAALAFGGVPAPAPAP